jgi:ATP-dependent exoDNAse (exonuclease V) alpha subunit
MTLTPHQQQALDKIKTFINDPASKAFVLKGYAGTGKTTLVSYVVQWLEKHTDYSPVLLASTGRAAKVLADKTQKETETVHGHIYRFSVIEEKSSDKQDAWNSSTGQLLLNFELRDAPLGIQKYVYIIDEASMLSHIETSPEHLARFGSGNLLKDLFHFAAGNHKIIFVGDPVQLPPPVGKNPFSPALNEQFLKNNLSPGTVSIELQEILRQKEGHAILSLATQLRKCVVENNYTNWEDIMSQPGTFIYHPYTQDIMIARYLKAVASGWDKGIILTHSNKQAYYLNITMRKKLHGKFNPVPKVGEVLMVVQNSYHVPLCNGDQVILENIRDAGTQVGFNFLEVRVRNVHDGNSYETYMLRDFLFSPEANLFPEDSKKLLVDFDKRARNRGLKRNSQDYLRAMRNDKYLNALRAKFGYAVTCHKAQGGEWPQVFLNLSDSLNNLDHETRFRWLYTAVTRAKQALDIKPLYKQPPPAPKNDNEWTKRFPKRR